MKPSFALNFSEDGVGLLHRTATGWLQVGEAQVADPHLTETLGYLRSTAQGLEPRGIATKLVIPASQVLYLTLTAPGPETNKRRAQIKRALQGRTPYAVDDLVFDWSGPGPQVQVAVVARETLEEAEGFAREHRFNPMSFVTIPPEGQFGGEPFFGATAQAEASLPQGEKLERDREPIRLAGRRDAALAPVLADSAVAAPAPVVAAQTAPVTELGTETVPPVAAAPAEMAANVAAPDTLPAAAPVVPEAPVVSEALVVPEAPAVSEAPAPVAAPPVIAQPVAEPKAAPAAMFGSGPAAAMIAVSDPVAAGMLGEAASHGARDAEPVAKTEPAAKAEPVSKAPLAAEDVFEADSARLLRRASRLAEARQTAVKAPEARPAEAPLTSAAPQANAADVTPAAPAPLQAAAPDVPEAPAMFDVPLEDGDDVPPMPGYPPAFASRRDAVVKAASENRDPAVLPRAGAPRLGGAPLPGSTADVTAPSLPSQTVAPLGDPDVPQAKPAAQRVLDPRARMAGPVKPAAPTGPMARFVPMKAKPGVIKPQASVPPKVAARIGKKTAPDGAASGNVFGARSRTAQPGKPRYLALGLTLALLAFLAAVAIWSTFFLNDGVGSLFGPADTAVVSADPAETEKSADLVIAPDALDPVAGDTALADGSDSDAAPLPDLASVTPVLEPEAEMVSPGAEPGVVEPEQGVVEAEAAPVAAPVPEPATVATVLADPITVAVAPQAESDGVAVSGPPPAPASDSPALGLDETGAAPTGVLSSSSPVTLPQAAVAEADTRPQTPLPPAPFGTSYERDARGFVIATPQGAPTPEGAVVFAGKPARVPPARPAAIAAAAEAVVPEAATPDAAVAGATADPTGTAPVADAGAEVASDPALAGFRPRARPEGLAGNAAIQEDSALKPETVLTADTPRPAPRPAALAAVAVARIAAATDAASAQAATVAVLEAPAIVTASTSPQAVTASRRPGVRPKDFSAAVAAALAAAGPAPEPVAQTIAVAMAQPAPRPQVQAQPVAAAPAIAESDAEPETVSAMPAIPTNASVAKQATLTNAVRLGRINLIGVFGAPSDRHAMVMMGNGRLVRVKVGDRIDGGKVAAIGENQLSYVKNGRNLILSMPKDT